MIKFYRNEETKAVVVALHGEACPGMKELVANTTDAAQEKHVMNTATSTACGRLNSN